MDVTPATRSIFNPRSTNTIKATERNLSFSTVLQDDYYDDNVTQLYDYYDLPVNDSDPLNISVPSVIDVRSAKSDPTEVTMNSNEITTKEKQLHSGAFSPTLPTITAQDQTDQRIVGGDEAIPGEIPWQVQ